MRHATALRISRLLILLGFALAAPAMGGARADEPHDRGAPSGHHHGAQDHGTHTHGGPAIGTPGSASATTRVITVTLIDTAFEPKTLTVKAGETVRFVIRNTGQLLHEFNIGTAAMHAAHQKEMAIMAEHGMITATGVDEAKMKMDHSHTGHGESGSPGAMKHDDPNSVLVAPGETKELVWQFPQATKLEFACNLPGHYEAGMVGKVEFAH